MISWLTEALDGLAGLLLGFLPDSPFSSFIDDVCNAEWLGYINYFIPIGDFITIALAWGSAIAVFYVYSVLLRWVKMIGD